jgi:predicted house-cleaning noncanonical NTP pyrophosphatase (MazG superfamily)
LGKQYSAKAIEERYGFNIAGEEKRNQIYDKLPSKESLIENLQHQKDRFTVPDLVKIIDGLIQADYSSDYIPNQLKNKKKKKRRGLSRN